MRFLRPMIVAALIAASTPLPLNAVPVSGQRTYASPQAAAEALLDAVVSGDRRELRPLFGIDAPRIAASSLRCSLRVSISEMPARVSQAQRPSAVCASGTA